MLVVMDQGASQEQIDRVIAAIEKRGFSARPIPGGNRMAIGILYNPGSVDPAEVQQVKALIRKTEAIAATSYCQIPRKNCHFLEMPFYQTGRVQKLPLSEEDISIVLELLRRLRPEIIFAAGDLSDPLARLKLRRSMPPTVVVTQPGPQRTMGLEAYVQGTSPIRRLGDLIAQRQLLALLDGSLEVLIRESPTLVLVHRWPDLLEDPLQLREAVERPLHGASLHDRSSQARSDSWN